MSGIKEWFPFYAGDWITDTDLQLCSLEAQGLLVNMMALSWHKETPGVLNYSPSEIAHLLRVEEEPFDLLFQALLNHRRIEVVSGSVIIPRLQSIGQTQAEKHLKRVEAGKLGGRKPNEEKPKEKKPRKKAEKKAEAESQFEEFWNGVPNKISKGYARECFSRALKKASFEEIMAGLPAYHQYEKKRQKQEGYQPLHPSTWLNRERWTDELKYNAPKVFETSINMADGTTQKFKTESKEKLNTQMADFIAKNNLVKKVSHKGFNYYEKGE